MFGRVKRRIRDLALQRGVLVQNTVPPDQLLQLISAIRPQKTRLELIRVGGSGDGGYLIPRDLEGVTACFSPGVGRIASFEQELLQAFGINSHLADRSVAAPPEGFTPLSFTHKFVGSHDSGEVLSLDRWMEAQPEFPRPGDFILQMDIEGAEYETLLSTARAKLQRCRILVIEFHGIESWAENSFFRIVRATFDKLLQDFIVVHSHPNNCCGIADVGGVPMPRVIELTFLRRDRAESLGACDAFPHPLDRPNVEGHVDLVLPPVWQRAS